MSVETHSFSSNLMLRNTLYRNQPESSKRLAGAGYALIAGIAAVETVASAIFLLLSLIVFPFSSTPLKHTSYWFDSSAFSIVWSVVDFCLNPFIVKLVADEKSARIIARSGNLMMLPPGAVL